MRSLTLPNKISLSRILFILPLVFCITQVQHNDNYRYACLFIMMLIALSDVLDGYLARKRNEITKLGIYLDPFTDKIVIITAYIMLSSERVWPEPRFPVWIPALIVCNDFILILGTIALLYFTGKVNCQPILIGKISTCLQITAIIFVIVGNHVPYFVLIVLWWLTAILTSLSGIYYIYRGVRQL